MGILSLQKHILTHHTHKHLVRGTEVNELENTIRLCRNTTTRHYVHLEETKRANPSCHGKNGQGRFFFSGNPFFRKKELRNGRGLETRDPSLIRLGVITVPVFQ